MASTIALLTERSFSILRDLILRPDPVVITSSGGIPEQNLFLVDASAGDIVIDLPSPAVFNHEEIYFKRIDNTTNTVCIVAGGIDNFEGEAGFTKISLASRDQYVKLKYDNSGLWRIVERNTISAAALSITTPTTINISTTPTKFDKFDTVRISTPDQVEADLTNDVIKLKQIENASKGDGYDIRFVVNMEYNEDQRVTVQLYAGGAAVPDIKARALGAEDGQGTSIVFSGFGVFDTVEDLELRIFGSSSASNKQVHSASFVAKRVKG